jgi:excisionase family DNA binding protein
MTTNHLTSILRNDNAMICHSTLRAEVEQHYLQLGEQKFSLSKEEAHTLRAFLAFLRQEETVIPNNSPEITTQEAADILNVSRPYLVKLLENGEIPFCKTGNRRKVKLQDVLTYRQMRDRERRETLKAFSTGLEEDGLYDLDYDSVQEILNASDNDA